MNAARQGTWDMKSTQRRAERFGATLSWSSVRHLLLTLTLHGTTITCKLRQQPISFVAERDKRPSRQLAQQLTSPLLVPSNHGSPITSRYDSGASRISASPGYCDRKLAACPPDQHRAFHIVCCACYCYLIDAPRSTCPTSISRIVGSCRSPR